MENKKNDFYIGWKSEAPDAFAQKIKKFIWIILFVVPIVAMSLVLSQQGFEDSNFEFGTLTAVEGTLFLEPVPMIKTMENGKIKTILLVGFGKIGAEKTFEAYLEKNPDKKTALNNADIKLNGTLIYHDGKTLLELTEGINSIIKWENKSAKFNTQTKALGTATLRGEIYDPKCAFGVMKPGYGKPHRSCAVRCISGGIPPVLKIENKNGEKNYCILLGENGDPINKEILDYVADQVQVCGRLEQQDDWLFFYTDPRSDILRLQPHFIEGELPLCSD
ncbi:MAG: hypothetical protein AAFZ15_02540 [Bacteroidota bacterium]